MVHKEDRVFIKVNGTMAKPKETGAVVDVGVLWAVVEATFAAGAAEVAVGDAAVLEQGGTLPIFETLGCQEMARATGARLVDLNGPPFARVRVPGGGLAYRSLIVREDLRAFDVVLNVAKMKNHSAAGVTLGLKNIFGMSPMNALMGYTKTSFHADFPEAELVRSTPAGRSARSYAGEFLRAYPSARSHDKLARVIVDHNRVFPSSLVVIDGVIGMDGNGPWEGDPVHANVLVAGYFQTHHRRMQYMELREEGYVIGSGMVESGGKQFKARFCGPGMRWNRSGIERLIPIRAAILSECFDSAWQTAYHSPPN